MNPMSLRRSRSASRPAPARQEYDWSRIDARREAEKADHDKAVRDYSDDLLIRAGTDIYNRKGIHDQKDPEHRFILGRRAAITREVQRRGLKPPEFQA